MRSTIGNTLFGVPISAAAVGVSPKVTDALRKANVDGTAGAWIDTLVSQAPSGLDAIFRASPSYPGSTDGRQLRAWLSGRK